MKLILFLLLSFSFPAFSQSIKKNADGSAQVFFKDGSSTRVGDYQEGTFVATLTGITPSFPTVTAKFVRVGKMVVVTIPENTGTSNTTLATITGMPASIRPLAPVSFYGRSINSSVSAVVMFQVSTGGVIEFFSTIASAAFNNTGLKGHGQVSFSYTLN